MTRLPLLLLLIFWLLPPTTAKRMQTICIFRNPLQIQDQWEYYRPGDSIIGGNLPLATISSASIPDFQNDPFLLTYRILYESKSYQQFLALMFVVAEVNKDLVLLPNITLGFHIYNHFQVERKISLISLFLLSTQDQMLPGYKCDQKDILLSVIGGLKSKSSRQMASIFSIFKVPQLGADFDFTQADRKVYPSFFRINTNEFSQYVGLVQLFLYFQWNWAGLVAPKDDSGERFISNLMPMFKEKEICLSFTEMLKSDNIYSTVTKLLHIFPTWTKTEVIILFGDSSSITSVQVALYTHEKIRNTPFWKVWILTSHWKLSAVGSQDILQVVKPFHGALHFRDHTTDVSEFRHFILSLDPLTTQGDVFLPLWKEGDKNDWVASPPLPPAALLIPASNFCKEGANQTCDNMAFIDSGELGYRFSDPVLRDKTQFPTFYQIDPQYHIQNAAIVRLLLYFQWNWIGVVVQ
ncbi:hypothetical protein E2320_022341, partial [Naja naja]